MMRDKRYGHYKKTPRVTNKILVWTGNLQDGFRKKVTNTRLVVNNIVKYFKYNQGTRKMLAINKKVITITVKNINNYLKTLVK